MAKIVRANDISLGNQTRLNINTAARENIGLIGQGQLVRQSAEVELQKRQYFLNQRISETIDAEGQKLFNESKAAYQASVLSDKMNSATENFIKGKLSRYKTTVDENGNYTYRSLPKDIENIGNDILKQTAKTITDPEIAQQFALRFNSYISNQKISALQEASKQQVAFGLESLDRGLGGVINQASKDNIDQLDTYYSQGVQILNDALVGGVISKPDHEQKLQQFNLILKDRVLRNVINNDRITAINTLNKSASELGITEEEKVKYSKLLDTTLKSDQIAVKKAEELQRIDNATEESSLIEDLKARMEADTLREDELMAFDGLISPNRFSQMKTEYVQQARKREAERQKLSNLSLRLLEGDSLNDVSNSDINNIYHHMLQQRAHITNSAPTLSEQAQIASLIPQPVKEFATTLEASIKNGTPKDANEMLAAYTYIKDRKKNTLDSSFGKDAIAIMEYTENLVNKGGLSTEEALVQARETLTNSSSELYRNRLKEFNADTDFTLANIQETAASDLGIQTGIFGFRDNNISPEVSYDYKNFVREGYAKLGDMDAARKYAVELMNRRYGISEISGEKQYMLNPPEKVWPNVSSSDLRNILLEDVTSILPEGTDIETISINSDDITSNSMTLKYDANGNVINEKVPTWTISFTDKDTGFIKPLLDPETGQILRWSPVGTKYYDTKKAKLLSEAKEENIRQREKRSGDQTTSPTGQYLESLSTKPGLI